MSLRFLQTDRAKIILLAIPMFVFIYALDDWYRSGWWSFYWLMVIAFLSKYWRLNRFFTVAAAYTLGWCGLIISDRFMTAQWSLPLQLEMNWETAQVILILIGIPLILDSMSYSMRMELGKFIGLLYFIDVVFTLFCWFMGFEHIGLQVNKSLNGTFLAITMPFALGLIKPNANRFKYAVITAGLIACLLTQARIGAAGLYLGALVYWFMSNRKLFVSWLMIGAIAGSGLLIIKGQKLFYLAHRDAIWKTTWFFLQDTKSWIFGLGPGSTFKWLSKAQTYYDCAGHSSASRCMDDLFQSGTFIFVHNDFLQLILEQGIVGFILWMMFFSHIAWSWRRVPELMAFCVAFAVNAMGSLPSHLFLTVFPFALLMNEFVKGRNKFIT